MDRVAATTAALVGAVALAGIPALTGNDAAASSADVIARPLASVRVIECSHGQEAADRQAVFRGTMRRLPGTGRMGMRFTLQERVGDGRFRNVKAPGLGVWRKSLPGLRRFSYRQRVLALAEGATYRAVVRFRWYGADGETVHRTKRRSRVCEQPGPLPNLAVVRVGGSPVTGSPGTTTYTVRVANRGLVSAPKFAVRLAVDGAVVDTRSVASLVAGGVRDIAFAGLACEESVTARIDPADLVREASERDNALSTACPLAG